ncbi:hypothetical protein ACF0H5_008686 [Mactra antiquata]
MSTTNVIQMTRDSNRNKTHNYHGNNVKTNHIVASIIEIKTHSSLIYKHYLIIKTSGRYFHMQTHDDSAERGEIETVGEIDMARMRQSER